MLTYYLFNNIQQYLSQSIEFNDLIRCIVNPGSSDVNIRYDSEDKFFRHFEDELLSTVETDFLYPFISVSFGDHNKSQRYNCNTEINVQFRITVRKCTLENCAVTNEPGNCSIAVGDPRNRINRLACVIAGAFYRQEVDIDGVIQTKNLFTDLRCTQQEFYDPELDSVVTDFWKYNVWAELRSDPIISSMFSREDQIFEQNIVLPLRVYEIKDDCVCRPLGPNSNPNPCHICGGCICDQCAVVD